MRPVITLADFFYLKGEDLNKIEKIAMTPEPVLLLGPTGCGKSCLAQAIHLSSARHSKKLVSVSLASLPSTLFESELFGHVRGAFTGSTTSRAGLIAHCHSGTLVLEDITELSLENQAKFLSFLDTREVRKIGSNQFDPVDVRVIATTNRDIRMCVQRGIFREDLYYRLAEGFEYQLPALNHISTEHFERIFLEFVKQKVKANNLVIDCQKITFEKKAMTRIITHMRGNYRGMKYLANHFSLLGKQDFHFDDLPEYLRKESRMLTKLNDVILEVTQELIRDAMKAHNNNQVMVAEHLGISRNTLRKHLELLKQQ